MFCSNCGKQVTDGAKVCPYCGTELNSQPMPEPVATQAKGFSEARTENFAKNAQNSNRQRNMLGGLIGLAILVGIVLFWANGLDFGNAKDIEAAEKQVISLVTKNYGAVPTVHGEVIKKVNGHVLIVVTFEVKMDGYTLDGSYILDVRGNHYVRNYSKELSADYDYKGHLDEIIALWGI